LAATRSPSCSRQAPQLLALGLLRLLLRLLHLLHLLLLPLLPLLQGYRTAGLLLLYQRAGSPASTHRLLRALSQRPAPAQPSLEGSASLLLIATLNPHPSCYQGCQSTLQFAQNAVMLATVREPAIPKVHTGAGSATAAALASKVAQLSAELLAREERIEVLQQASRAEALAREEQLQAQQQASRAELLAKEEELRMLQQQIMQVGGQDLPVLQF
jgi:hypothetical protein